MKCTDLQELAAAHALGALPRDDAARAEALAAHDEDVRAELAAFHDTAAALAAGLPQDVKPSAALRARVLDRIAQTPQANPANAPEPTPGFTFRRHGDGEWRATPLPGVRIKRLSASPDLGHQTLLLELAPNATYPSHDHHGSEELFLLSGDLVTEGRTLGPGDYLHAEPGSHHGELFSPNGCVALIIGPIHNSEKAAVGAQPVSS